MKYQRVVKLFHTKALGRKALKEDSAETLIFSNMLETFYELPVS